MKVLSILTPLVNHITLWGWRKLFASERHGHFERESDVLPSIWEKSKTICNLEMRQALKNLMSHLENQPNLKIICLRNLSLG